MKKIVITIPDNKEELFIELMKDLSFVEWIEPIEYTEIPAWYKVALDARTQNPEQFKDRSKQKDRNDYNPITTTLLSRLLLNNNGKE